MAGHQDGEAWGLALCEKTGTFLTSGDDNKIMKFDYKEKKFVDQAKISDHASKNEKKIKAVTASTTSSFPKNQQARGLAVSKAGHVAVCNHFGKVSIRLLSDMNKKIASLKDAEEWCEVMKYSPDEKYLAVGSHDNGVYIYEIDGENYKLAKRFMKHSSYVTCLDWSADSTYVRSVCGAYSKLYWKISDMSFDSDGLKNTKDTIWDSLSMKLGWEVDGIFPSGEDGTHINSVNSSKDG
jgi:WD40 repeat protein